MCPFIYTFRLFGVYLQSVGSPKSSWQRNTPSERTPVLGGGALDLDGDMRKMRKQTIKSVVALVDKGLD